jgi:hypothetical protein
MDGWSTTINFMLLTILLILYFSSLACEIFYFTNGIKDFDFLFFLFVFDSIFSLIMIIITILFGFFSIYFSLRDKLYIYIIILSFALFIKSIYFILYCLEYKNNNGKIILFIIYIIQLIMKVLNLISSIYERNKLIKEIEESPLNYVDETITEDIYNSILSQCLNPEDKKLRKEFQKTIKKRKERMSKIST